MTNRVFGIECRDNIEFISISEWRRAGIEAGKALSKLNSERDKRTLNNLKKK